MAGEHSPAGAGGDPAGPSVEFTVEQVKRVADVTLPDLEDKVGRGRSSFSGLVETVQLDTLFGHNAAGRALAATHGAAHDVFVQTVAGVGEDLRSFQERLQATIRTYDTSDADAEALLLALSRRPLPEQSHADLRQERAVRDHQTELTGPVGSGGHGAGGHGRGAGDPLDLPGGPAADGPGAGEPLDVAPPALGGGATATQPQLPGDETVGVPRDPLGR